MAVGNAGLSLRKVWGPEIWMEQSRGKRTSREERGTKNTALGCASVYLERRLKKGPIETEEVGGNLDMKDEQKGGFQEEKYSQQCSTERDRQTD